MLCPYIIASIQNILYNIVESTSEMFIFNYM